MAGSSFAVPAFPGKVKFSQPSNRDITVDIYLKGDEKVHWAETEDGYTLLHDNDGNLVYAVKDLSGDLVATDILATNKESRTAEVMEMLETTPKHLRFSKKQVDEMLSIWKQVEDAKKGPKAITDLTGEKRFLVILFGFQDRNFTYGKTAFRLLFNQVNYTAGGRTGSVRDYYHDVSGGLFTLKMDVVGPYIGSENTSYYGSTDWGAQYFAREAVDSAAKDVDFSLYDNDHDGNIDGLHIIFAGYGEEAGAPSSAIWSHKWNIFDPPTYDGTVIDVYSCSPELSGSGGESLTAIGVICHELGHVFGAPDYYDTDYEGSGGQFPGLSYWDIMSGGSWNHGGISPAQHNPYTKIYIYKWANCDTINNKTGIYKLKPITGSNDEIKRVNTSTPGDFFLIENRQQNKWDQYLPSHGMLVYHIHPNANGANVSNYRHPQQIYIIAKGSVYDTFPSGTPSSYGSVSTASAVFPSLLGRRDSLTDNSIPWFRPWSKVANNVPLTNISEDQESQNVFFTYNASPIPMKAVAEGVSRSAIEINWTRYGSLSTMIVMSEGTNGIPVQDSNYAVGDIIGNGTVVYVGNGNRALIDSLEANHTYNFRLFTMKRLGGYSDGVDVTASTINCNDTMWLSEDFETTDSASLPYCWLGEWSVREMAGQQSLFSDTDSNQTERIWENVLSRPLVMDSIRDLVLNLRLHFDGECSEQTLFKIEYRDAPNGNWETLDSIAWTFGGSTWRNLFYILPSAGDYSRLRFSVFTNGKDMAAIDDITITPGTLVFASSDDNGDIKPRGYSIVEENDTLVYSIKPLSGYKLKRMRLDGAIVGMNQIDTLDGQTLKYRYVATRGVHTIHVDFERTNAIDLADSPSITVFPNPTDGMTTITFERDEDILLYDLRGRLVGTYRHDNGKTEIDMSNLPKGIYLIRIGDKTQKIIKL